MSKFEQFFRRQSMQSILAVMGNFMIFFFFLIIFINVVPKENREIVFIIIGYLIGKGNTIDNFFFGNSKKSTTPEDGTKDT